MDYTRFMLSAAAVVAVATQAACNMPNPAFGLDTESGSAGSVGGGSRGGSASAGSGMSGTGSGTGTSGTSTSDGTGPTMTTGVTTGGTSFGSTGGVDMGVATAGTTGGLLCPPAPSAGDLDVQVQFGVDPPQVVKGGSVNITGVLSEYLGGVWTLRRCENMDPCAPSCASPNVKEALVMAALPPGGWDPPSGDQSGNCYSATMHWNQDGSFQGGAIWQMEVGGLLSQDPVWAARGVGPEPGMFNLLQFSLDPKPTDTCACEIPGCCTLEPGTYKLKVAGALVLDGGQSLAPGESDTGTLSQNPAMALNVTSMVEPFCDAAHEHFTWIVKEAG